jgi:hypothetical protein
MSVSHEVAGIGKWGASRVDIFLDEMRVGVADYNPLEDRFFFEPLLIPTEGQIIALAQSKNAGEKEMDRMCAERDAAEDKLKVAQAPENREAIRIYVSSIRSSVGLASQVESQIKASAPVFEPSPEPSRIPLEVPECTSGTVIVPQAPVIAESSVDHNKIIMLENRVDRIDNLLKRIESRLIAVENSIEQFDIRGTREKLDLLGTQISNLRAEYKVTAANFRIHQQRCYCNSHFPGGFTKRDETPEDTNSAHASSKP